jgi:hypothetical protein
MVQWSLCLPKNCISISNGMLSGGSNSLNISGNAVLSQSINARIIGLHFPPATAVELKNRVSFNASTTGLRQAFKVILIRLISRRSSIVVGSRSNALSPLVSSTEAINTRRVPHFSFQRGSYNIIDNIVARSQYFIVVHQKLAHTWYGIRSDVLRDLQ